MLKITITEIDQDFKLYTTEQLAHIIDQAEEIVDKLLHKNDAKLDDAIKDHLEQVASLLFDAQFRLHDALDEAALHGMN